MQTDEAIGFTKVALPYGWMGNMSPYPIEYGGVIWRTSEALFQAMRFTDPEIKEAIRAEKSPMGAKFKAKSFADQRTVEPLSKEDVDNMKLCVRLKVEQHPGLKHELIRTQNTYIFEDVTARGLRGSNAFWGALRTDYTRTGMNVLGKIWMELRDEFLNL